MQKVPRYIESPNLCKSLHSLHTPVTVLIVVIIIQSTKRKCQEFLHPQRGVPASSFCSSSLCNFNDFALPELTDNCLVFLLALRKQLDYDIKIAE